MSIAIKRACDAPAKDDGYRVLVERLWPRGMTREAVPLDQWAKELAPSTVLRKWFAHDPARWDGFRHRYASELDGLVEHWQPLAERSARHKITLIYSTRDEEHNSALALRDYLRNWLHTHGPR